MSSLVEQYDPPSAEQPAAATVTEALRAGASCLTTPSGTVPIPDGLATLFERIAQAAADGSRISVRVGDQQLTPREAAEELGVSRTYVCRLMDDNKLAFERVGAHRRIPADEVDRFRTERAERLAAQYRDRTAGLPDAPDEPMPAGPRTRRKRPGRS